MVSDAIAMEREGVGNNFNAGCMESGEQDTDSSLAESKGWSVECGEWRVWRVENRRRAIAR